MEMMHLLHMACEIISDHWREMFIERGEIMEEEQHFHQRYSNMIPALTEALRTTCTPP